MFCYSSKIEEVRVRACFVTAPSRVEVGVSACFVTAPR